MRRLRHRVPCAGRRLKTAKAPREFITAVLLWLAASLSVSPGIAFAQSSLPVVAILRATGDESASVSRNGAASEIARQAKQASLPTMCQWREMAEAGCMVSYGTSFAEAYRLTAAQMDRVLRGANPAELPIQQPTRFELVVNLTTARELGLAFSAPLLARADELIE
jgi:putative ABC transport system substrate-binding protein